MNGFSLFFIACNKGFQEMMIEQNTIPVIPANVFVGFENQTYDQFRDAVIRKYVEDKGVVPSEVLDIISDLIALRWLLDKKS